MRISVLLLLPLLTRFSCTPSSPNLSDPQNELNAKHQGDSLREILFTHAIELKQHQIDSIVALNFTIVTVKEERRLIHNLWSGSPVLNRNGIAMTADTQGTFWEVSNLASLHPHRHDALEIVTDDTNLVIHSDDGYDLYNGAEQDFGVVNTRGECRLLFYLPTLALAEFIVADTGKIITVNALSFGDTIESYELSATDKRAIFETYALAKLYRELDGLKTELENIKTRNTLQGVVK